MPNCILVQRTWRDWEVCARPFFVQQSVVKAIFVPKKKNYLLRCSCKNPWVVESVPQWCSTWYGLMMEQTKTVEMWCQPPTNIPFNQATSTNLSLPLLTLMKNHDWGHGREWTTASWCRLGNTKGPSQTVALYQSPSLPNSGIGCSDQTLGRGPWSREREFGYGLVQTETGYLWALPQISRRIQCFGIDFVHFSDSRDDTSRSNKSWEPQRGFYLWPNFTRRVSKEP